MKRTRVNDYLLRSLEVVAEEQGRLMYNNPDQTENINRREDHERLDNTQTVPWFHSSD